MLMMSMLVEWRLRDKTLLKSFKRMETYSLSLILTVLSVWLTLQWLPIILIPCSTTLSNKNYWTETCFHSTSQETMVQSPLNSPSEDGIMSIWRDNSTSTMWSTSTIGYWMPRTFLLVERTSDCANMDARSLPTLVLRCSLDPQMP